MPLNLYKVWLRSGDMNNYCLHVKAGSPSEAIEIAIEDWNAGNIASLEEHENDSIWSAIILWERDLDTPGIITELDE